MRILHMMGGADIGGMSAVVLNYYQNMDRDRFHFDLAVAKGGRGRNADVLEGMGSRVLELTPMHGHMRAYVTELTAVLRNQHYDCVHVHYGETSYVPLLLAKSCGVPSRIAHSHTTSPTTTTREKLRRLSGVMLNKAAATRLLACGQLAGERVFGRRAFNSEKGLLLPNAIQTDAFTYSETARSVLRKEFGLADDAFVMGLVGRLADQKNPIFALRVVDALCRNVPSAVLLIAGGGPLEGEMRKYVSTHVLDQNVRFLGSRNDMASVYSALDCIVMPSLYEGFPVAVVEALCSNLPIILSDGISREMRLSRHVKFLPIDGAARWAEELELVHSRDSVDRRRNIAKEKGYDISDTARLLETVYEPMS